MECHLLDEVPSGEHVAVMMDANARNGGTEDGSTPDKVMGAYGHDNRNDNRRRLVDFAAKWYTNCPRHVLLHT